MANIVYYHMTEFAIAAMILSIVILVITILLLKYSIQTCCLDLLDREGIIVEKSYRVYGVRMIIVHIEKTNKKYLIANNHMIELEEDNNNLKNNL